MKIRYLMPLRLMLLTLFVSAADQSFAAVRESVKTDRYVVRGNVAQDVRNLLNKKGPQGFDAYTSWNIRWSFTYRNKDGRCIIQSVTTRVDIRYTMPRLETDNSALKQSFNAYLKRLQIHEDGHADNGRNVARRIDEGIKGLSELTCARLGTSANALGAKISREGNAFDLKYDAETDHGRTQGAIWN